MEREALHEEVFIKGSWEKKTGCERIEGEQRHTEMLFKAPQGKRKRLWKTSDIPPQLCFRIVCMCVCVCVLHVMHKEGIDLEVQCDKQGVQINDRCSDERRETLASQLKKNRRS